MLIIDFDNFAHRSFWTYGQQGLTSPDGSPSGVTFGIISMALALIGELAPSHVAVCFESLTPGERRTLFPAYKAQRGPTDESLKAQMSPANVATGRMGWARYRAPGFEADDAMAALAHQALGVGFERVWLATGDQDLLGVVTDDIGVLLMGGGARAAAAAPMTPALVRDKLGVDPAQVACYKALTGDSSDNYPGVPGIGPAKAKALLERYGDLATIFERLEEITPVSLRELLRVGRESGELCRQLATLRGDAELSPAFDPAAGELARIDPRPVAAYLGALGMTSLVRRLPKGMGLALLEAPAA